MLTHPHAHHDDDPASGPLWGSQILAWTLILMSKLGLMVTWFGQNLANIGIFVTSMVGAGSLAWKIRTDKSRMGLAVRRLEIELDQTRSELSRLRSVSHEQDEEQQGQMGQMQAELVRVRKVMHDNRNQLNKYRLLLIDHGIVDPYEVPTPPPMPPRPAEAAGGIDPPTPPLPGRVAKPEPPE